MLIVLAWAMAGLGLVGLAVMAHALWSAVRLAPAARRGRAVRMMLRWQFGAVAVLGGNAVIPHTNRYLRANMLVLGVIAVSLIVWGVVLIDEMNGTPIDVGELTAAEFLHTSVLES